MLNESCLTIKKLAMHLILAAILGMVILAGCGEDDNGGDEGPVGSASVSWSMECPEDDPLAFIAQVYDSSKRYLTYGGPWACAAHIGTVTDIPIGPGRKIVLFAEDQAGSFVYRGEKHEINIKEAAITDAGDITTYSFATAVKEPYYEPLTQDTFSLCLAWDFVVGAARYKIEIADNIDFIDSVISEINSGPPYKPADLDPSITYYWRVSSIDLYTNQGIASDIGQVKPGPTVIINSPSDGENFSQYDEIPLQGNAVDEIDGLSLTSDALSWSSNIKGPLGTGDYVEFFGNTPGTHIITLSAMNKAGYTGRVSITIHIAE